MAFYPNLAECGIAFMHFSMHIAGGWKEIKAFWSSHGHEEGEERLLFSGYMRNGNPHTVWVRWDRSHKECCDIWIGLQAERPAKTWPNRPAAIFRLREKALKDFFRLLSSISEAPPLVRAHYGFPWDNRLENILRLSPRVRPKSLSLEVTDERGKPVMAVTYEKRGNVWLAVVAPSGRFQLDDQPVTDAFFKAPYDTACLLAKKLGQEQIESR